ncbi:MAG: hypothetical protein WD342_00630 [Verrucomicrobiales bacterium]
MARLLVMGGLAATMFSSGAYGQFHAKSEKGGTAVNQQAARAGSARTTGSVQPGAAQPSAAQPSAAQPRGPRAGGFQTTGIQRSGSEVGINALSTIYMSEAQKKAFAANNARLGEMESRYAEVWGRSIHHSDGSYTESKQDNETNTLEQTTKSKNGTTLQKRVVMLDKSGRPSEVMIYGGRGDFKYRGVQVYDQLGRFSEEQLYDADGTLIRRKVQEYAPDGQKLPGRSWDYVANVPEDLKLVIVQEDENQGEEEAARQQKSFGNQKRREAARSEGSSRPVAAQAQSEAVSSEKRKGLNLGRFFSGKQRK